MKTDTSFTNYMLSSKPLMLDRSMMNMLSTAQGLQAMVSQERKPVSNYEIEGKIAIIPVQGILTKRGSLLDRFFGITSYELLSELITEAVGDKAVEGIILDVDSPGGEVSGLFDLVDQIVSMKEEKPIWAVANESAFSAAYAIASACDKIMMSRTGGVGSIGVIASHIDQSGYDDKQGIKVTNIFAGDRKNDLNPHEPLSDTASSLLQEEVNRLYGMFVETVSRNRKLSVQQIRNTEAGLFFGQDAINIGLADELMTLSQSLHLFNHSFQSKPGRITMTTETPTTEAVDMSAESEPIPPMDINALTKEAQAQGREAYKREVLELAKTCSIAGMPEKLSSFIEQGMSVDGAKDSLMQILAERSKQAEITSHVEPLQATANNNTLIEMAKARAEEV